MQRIILAIVGLIILAVALNCGSGPAAPGSTSDSPTEAYKRLYAAVKRKDTDAIRREMTERSIDLAKMASAKNGTPIEKVFENGLTGTTFSPTLPEIRDQRIVENQGAVEVWNSKDSKWEDLPFLKVDGVWRFAVGDLFSGSISQATVGRGRAFREAEAANAAGKGPVQIPIGPNANSLSTSNMKAPANANPLPPQSKSDNRVTVK
jgi:hypothetical protein